MRITNSMMINQFLSESNDALNRVSKYQSQVDSTKRINGIADDPQGTLLALKARSKLSSLDLYNANISTATSYLKEAESSVSELNEILKSAYDEIMSASSGSKTAEDQKNIVESLKNLQAEILSISNNTLGTSYIFGGFNSTGTISAGKKTPPFDVDTMGHLIYNGIDLSKFSYSGDYNNEIAQMATDMSALSDVYYKYSATNTDATNKSLAQSASDAVNKMIASGKAALDAAKAFDPTAASSSANFKALSEFIYGTDTGSPPVHTNGLVDFASALSNEASKDLTGSYILETDPSIKKTDGGAIDYDYYKGQNISVYKDEADMANMTANNFVSTATPPAKSAQSALQDVVSYLWGASLPATKPTWTSPEVSSATWLTTALAPLTSDLGNELAAALNATPAPPAPSQQTALDNEANKRMQLQIGTSQTVDVTMTGLDILGTGSNNIYHILGKAIDALSNGASADQLSSLVTDVQNAQSRVLNVETKIGATQNRLTLISNRYTSNEMNYTEMKSNAEDADVTEAYMHLTMAMQVYNAALSGGSNIIKTSLIDFLK